MSVVDFLHGEVESNEQHAANLTSRIEGLERDLTRLRDEREDCYRRQVELRIAANIIAQAGLTVERRAGTWTASVERHWAEPSSLSAVPGTETAGEAEKFSSSAPAVGRDVR